MDASVGEDDHDVGVGGEEVNVGAEDRVAHLHALELRLRLAAAEKAKTHTDRRGDCEARSEEGGIASERAGTTIRPRAGEGGR